LNSKVSYLEQRTIMQTILIRIALMLCLMEWAFAFNVPIQKEIVGQVDEGKNIIANALVANRRDEGDDITYPEDEEYPEACRNIDQSCDPYWGNPNYYLGVAASSDCCGGLSCMRRSDKSGFQCQSEMVAKSS